MRSGVGDERSAPQKREVIDRIIDYARQLGKLVAGTLTSMRAHDFRQTLKAQPIGLSSLLDDVVGRVPPLIEARHQHFKARLGGDLGEFQVEPAKIADILQNLLTNAISFTPDGGELGLSVTLVGEDEVEIVDADQGISLEPRALKRLFQPFFPEFDPSRHSSGEFGSEKRGLGVGSSIVRQFVELPGGSVSAQSTLGEGTRFTLRLPRQPFSSSKESLE